MLIRNLPTTLHLIYLLAFLSPPFLTLYTLYIFIGILSRGNSQISSINTEFFYYNKMTAVHMFSLDDILLKLYYEDTKLILVHTDGPGPVVAAAGRNFKILMFPAVRT